MQVGTSCFAVWSGNKHRHFGLVKHTLHGEGSPIGVLYTEKVSPYQTPFCVLALL